MYHPEFIEGRVRHGWLEQHFKKIALTIFLQHGIEIAQRLIFIAMEYVLPSYSNVTISILKSGSDVGGRVEISLFHYFMFFFLDYLIDFFNVFIS